MKFVLFITLVINCECRSLRRNRYLCSGTSKIDIKTNNGVKIEPFYQSNVNIDSLSEPFDDRHSLRFEFKTTASNGTLFYVVRQNNLNDMVSGSLHEGFPQFKIRCMTSFADLTIPVRVDDGEWHKVRFIRRHGKGIFLVDELEYFEQYYISCGGFTSINFGNRNPAHHKSKSVQELQDKDGHMNGCIRRLHISTGIDAHPHYTAVSECN